MSVAVERAGKSVRIVGDVKARNGNILREIIISARSVARRGDIRDPRTARLISCGDLSVLERFRLADGRLRRLGRVVQRRHGRRRIRYRK